jgi:hypothetical protein
MTTQTTTDRIPAERLNVGDIVRAVIDGPEGTVTAANRMGWTMVRYPTPHLTDHGLLSYRHGKDALYLVRKATADTPKPPFGTVTGEQERYLARVQLTDLERDALAGLVAAVVNDDEGFDTYGLSSTEKAAVRRALSKLSAAR